MQLTIERGKKRIMLHNTKSEPCTCQLSSDVNRSECMHVASSSRHRARHSRALSTQEEEEEEDLLGRGDCDVDMLLSEGVVCHTPTPLTAPCGKGAGWVGAGVFPFTCPTRKCLPVSVMVTQHSRPIKPSAGASST